ncbi:MAG: extracellular solute-binding protein [bacterium]
MSVVAVAACLLALASGCRKHEAAPSDPNLITLRLWQSYNDQERAVFDQLAAEFERDFPKKHPGKHVKIEVESVPFDNLVQNIARAAQAGITPDMARVDALKVVELAYGKVAVALDTLPSFKGTLEEKRDEFIPAAFDTNVINIKGETHLYGLPEQTTCLTLYWNRDHFRNKEAELRAAGLDSHRAPRDWDEMIAYGRILTDHDAGIYAFGHTNSLWFNFALLNTYEAPFIETDNRGESRCVVSRGGNAEMILQRLIDMTYKWGIEAEAWKSGNVPADQGFMNQRYSMVLQGPWNYKRFKDAGVNVGLALIPRMPKGDAIELGLLPKDASDAQYDERIKSSSNIGGNDLIILRSCLERGMADYAHEFLEFFTSTEVQTRWGNTLGQIPVNKAAADQIDKNANPATAHFIEQIKNARALPRIPLYAVLEEQTNRQLDLAFQRKMPLSKALKNIEQITDDQILSLVNE